jgi:RimJ/RimL family protein N-acetyltransferase
MREHLTTRTRSGRAIILRPLRHADAPRIQQACSDPETVRWLGGTAISERYNLDDAHNFVDRVRELVKAESHMSWAIADPDTDDLLGSVGLHGLHGYLTDTASLGYWSHPDARRAGVTTAAARAVVTDALKSTVRGGAGLRRLMLVTAVGNIGSRKVAEATGFQRAGQTRQSGLLFDGTFTDEVTYDLLASDLN